MQCLQLNVTDCELRSWRHDDATNLVKHANNRKIWLNLRDAFPHPYSLDDAHRFLNRVIGQSPETSFCISCDDEAIGGIGLRLGTDVERFSAELGYWLGEKYWGRGIATAAIVAMTQYGLTVLGLHRIFALPFERNPPSIRVLEKAGYACEGRLRESAFKDGQFENQLIYAWVRSQ